MDEQVREGLKCLELSGAIFLRAYLTAPWCYEVPRWIGFGTENLNLCTEPLRILPGNLHAHYLAHLVEDFWRHRLDATCRK